MIPRPVSHIRQALCPDDRIRSGTDGTGLTMSHPHQLPVLGNETEPQLISSKRVSRRARSYVWEERVVRQPRWRGYTAFVLSGGGARGALQVGALRALLEHGITPDVIVGTSIGSWNGAWVAHDPTAEGIEGLEAIWKTLTARRVLLGFEAPGQRQMRIAGLRVLVAARRVTSGYPSLYSDTGLRQLIAMHVGERTFDELRIPLRIIATDLTHGNRAIFKSGPLGPAILASSAIPGIFPPVCIDECAYIDGSALDNCSLETALELGARRIFVVDVDYDDGTAASPLWCGEPTPAALRTRGATRHALAAVLERMAQVVFAYQLQRALNRVPRGIEVHVIRPGAGVAGGVLDFERAPEWMDRAYAMTRKYLHARLPHPVESSAS